MEEKRECKIIQDLLPHYAEGLTSEQTNQYINEHLKECLECKKIFENMKKKLEFDGEKRDGREVKYIKIYNKKMKVLRNIVSNNYIIYNSFWKKSNYTYKLI